MNQLPASECIPCAIKHLAQAWICYNEVLNGYDEDIHRARVIGHMAEAEDHLLSLSKELAAEIREQRKAFESAGVEACIDMRNMIKDVIRFERLISYQEMADRGLSDTQES